MQVHGVVMRAGIPIGGVWGIVGYLGGEMGAWGHVYSPCLHARFVSLLYDPMYECGGGWEEVRLVCMCVCTVYVVSRHGVVL